MVFKYVRKTDQASWSEEIMAKAMKEVNDDKAPIKATADKYKIPYATLYRHIKSGNAIKKLGRFVPVFTEDQEEELCDYIKKMDSVFFGLTRSDLLELAYEFATKNHIKHPFKNGKAGDDWFAGFQRRHPEIVLRAPEPTSLARTRGFNRPQVERFYANYWEQVEKHGFNAITIYNMDETGVKTSTTKPPKVLSVKGKRQVGVISSTERGQLTTVICCCNAAGTFIPPFFIFARKKMQSRLLDGAPPGSQATVSDNGWVNGPAFLHWLRFFVDSVRPTPERKVLLLLDNHESHKYYPALEYARENNVVFVSFAPHTTDRMQPLDVAVYGPLKKYFEQELNSFQKNHPGRIINQYDMAKLFGGAFVKCASANNAIQGFRKPGIWPYNPHIFGDEDFAPSSMTERPENETATEMTTAHATLQEEQIISPSTETSTSDLNLPVTMPSSHQEIPNNSEIIVQVSPLPSSSSQERTLTPHSLTNDHLSSSKPNCSATTDSEIIVTNFTIELEREDSPERNLQEATPEKLTPFQIRPIPKMAAPKTHRQHKRQKSEVLTSTPVKSEQEAKFKKIEKKKSKISDLNAPGPSKAKKKRTKPRASSTKTKQSDWFCLRCSEKYEDPPAEDWIQCSQCQRWAHENCTSYAGHGSYFCEECND